MKAIELAKESKEVTKNQHILSRIIDCVKFCGAFELPSCGHNESGDSDNPGIFQTLLAPLRVC